MRKSWIEILGSRKFRHRLALLRAIRNTFSQGGRILSAWSHRNSNCNRHVVPAGNWSWRLPWQGQGTFWLQTKYRLAGRPRWSWQLLIPEGEGRGFQGSTLLGFGAWGFGLVLCRFLCVGSVLLCSLRISKVPLSTQLMRA